LSAAEQIATASTSSASIALHALVFNPRPLGVNPVIVVAPSQGDVGSSYTVTGSGFTSSSDAFVSFDIPDQTPVGCTDGSFVGPDITTDGSGGFVCAFTVPTEGAGGHAIGAYDETGNAFATAQTFTVTPAVTIYPAQGPVNTIFTVAGTGFSSGSDQIAYVSFDSGYLVPLACSDGGVFGGISVLIDSGSYGFNCSFKVPAESPGGYDVAGYDVSTSSTTPSQTFTVTAATIDISPVQTPGGATVTLTASGMEPNTKYFIYFDVVMGSADFDAAPGPFSSDGTGALDASFTSGFDGIGSGTYYADVFDYSLNSYVASASEQFTFTYVAITVTPGQGLVYSDFNVTGTGFSLSSGATVFGSGGFGGDMTPIGGSDCSYVGTTITTDASGGFTCMFSVPDTTPNTYLITGTDTATTDATSAQSFVLPANPVIDVTYLTEPANSTYEVLGVDFSASSGATVSFGGILQTPTGGASCSYVGTTITTDSSGTFDCMFVVPLVSPADYPVVGIDTASGASSWTTDPVTFTVTLPAIDISPTRGPGLVSITLTASELKPLTTYDYCFGFKIGGTDMCGGGIGTDGSGSMSTLIADEPGSGGFTGPFYVNLFEGGSNFIAPASEQFTETRPAITVNPDQGPWDTTYTVNGTGFTVTATATLSFDGTDQVPVICFYGGFSGTSITTDPTGNFSCAFVNTEPTAGSYEVIGTDMTSSLVAPTDWFTVTSVVCDISPYQGPVSTTVTMTASGLAPGMPYVMYLDATQGVKDHYLRLFTPDDLGDITTTFVAPSVGGGSWIVDSFEQVSGNYISPAAEQFIYTTPAVDIGPVQGPANTTVTLTASGLAPSTSYYLFFDDVQGSWGNQVASFTTSNLGAYTGTFVVPMIAALVWYVDVFDANSDIYIVSASEQFTLTTAVMHVSPAQGPAGASFTFTASGLVPSKSYYLFFDSVQGTFANEVAAFSTDSSGDFSGPMAAPAIAASVWYADVFDAAIPVYIASASEMFTLTTPAIALDTSSGPVGTLYNVTGTGFSVSSGATVSFWGNDQTPVGGTDCSYVGTVITTDAAGGFVCMFFVPYTPYGTYTIAGTDTATGAAPTQTFTIQTRVLLNPTSGDVGITTTATGTGFAASSTIAFSLDSWVASSTCDSNGTGSFTCTVTIPGTPEGVQTMNAEDASSNFGFATFMVYADPTVSVSPAGPFTYDAGQTAITLTATVTYDGSNTVSVEWYSSASTTCNSGSTDTGQSGATFTPSTASTGVVDYCAVVSDSGVLAYEYDSVEVTVVVYSALGTPALSPASASIDIGQSVTFTATWSGGTSGYTATLYSSVGACNSGGNWVQTISSATSPQAFTSVSPAGTLNYCVVVTDSADTAESTTSAASAVTVTADPTVSVAPAGPLKYDVGQTAALLTATLTYSGPNTATIWWYSSVSSTCNSAQTNLSQSGTTYTPVTTPAGTTYYCAAVADSGLPAYTSASNAVKVVVSSDPTISASPPGPLTYDVGQTAATITATVVYSGSNTASVEWYSSASSSCSGLSTDTGHAGLTYVPPTASATTKFYCAVVADSGVSGYSEASSAVEVIVNTVLVTPTLSPPSANIDVGQSVTFTATWSGGTSPYTASLYSSAGTCSSGSTLVQTIASAVSPKVFTAVSPASTVSYCVVITDSADTPVSTTSVESTVTVHADPTVSVAPGGPFKYDVGQPATQLSATITYNGPNTASVTWFSSASAPCTGGSTSTGHSGLTFTPSTAVSAVTYYCAVVTDSGLPAFSSASNGVLVTVSAVLGTPMLSPATATIDIGQSLVFTATWSGGTSPYTATLYSSSGTCSSGSTLVQAISSATSPQAFTAVSPASAVSYCVVVIDSADTPVSGTSGASTVTVSADPTVSVLPAGPFAYDLGQAASSLSATITYTGPNTATVEWYSSLTSTCNSGSTDTDHSGTTFTPPIESAGTTYYCGVISDSGVPGYSSASNSVEVIVGMPLGTPVLSPPSAAIDTGQSVIFTVAWSGGTSGFTATLYSSSGTCNSASTLVQAIISATTPQAFTAVSPVGAINYCAAVTDSANTPVTTTSAASPVTVNADPTVSVAPVGPFVYSVGQTATPLTATVTYSGVNTVSVEWFSATSSSCSGGSTTTGHSGLSYTPTTASAGTTYYCAVLSDSGIPSYKSVSSAVEITVRTAFSVKSFTASLSETDVGISTTFTVSVSGGVGPFTYAYTGLPPGCNSSNATTLACVPTGTGTFTVRVFVNDSTGLTATTTLSLTVNSAAAISQFTASASSVNVGDETTLSVSASGGTTPYTYAYTGLPGGCSTVDAATLACTPNTAGTFNVRVFVNDSTGMSISTTLTLTVNSGTTSQTSNSMYYIIGAVVIVVVVLLVVAMLFMRRKSSGSAPSKGEPKKDEKETGDEKPEEKSDKSVTSPSPTSGSNQKPTKE
jgi:hypothetical protein